MMGPALRWIAVWYVVNVVQPQHKGNISTRETLLMWIGGGGLTCADASAALAKPCMPGESEGAWASFQRLIPQLPAPAPVICSLSYCSQWALAQPATFLNTRRAATVHSEPARSTVFHPNAFSGSLWHESRTEQSCGWCLICLVCVNARAHESTNRNEQPWCRLWS